jgi:hypothetical protein
MSGGKFDYKQYEIDYIADQLEQIIRSNKDIEWYNYSDETILEFKKGLAVLKTAAVYAQRIDWLTSGDDSEKSFHER